MTSEPNTDSNQYVETRDHYRARLINSARGSVKQLQPPKWDGKTGGAVARKIASWGSLENGYVYAETLDDGIYINGLGRLASVPDRQRFLDNLAELFQSATGKNARVRQTPVGDIYTHEFAKWARITNECVLVPKSRSERRYTLREIEAAAEKAADAKFGVND